MSKAVSRPLESCPHSPVPGEFPNGSYYLIRVSADEYIGPSTNCL